MTVTWSVVDPDSTIGPLAGCGPVTIAADTAGETLTCIATSGGGTATQSVTIKRDATKPTLTAMGIVTAAATSPAGAKVAYAAPLAADMTAGLAGPPSCAPASGSDFAIGSTTVTCTSADQAGNMGSTTFAITVTDTGEPGRMHGDGRVVVDNDRVDFGFSVIETAASRPARSTA